MGWLQRVVGSGRIVACLALLASCAQIHNEPINQPLVPGARAVGRARQRRRDLLRRHRHRAVVFGRRHARGRLLLWRIDRARSDADAQPADLAARSRRLCHRRIGRIGARRLLRTEEAPGAGRFQATFSAAQRSGGAGHQPQPDQHREGPARRHQRSKQLFALARRQSVRTRDVQEPDASAAPADLDQCVRHL